MTIIYVFAGRPERILAMAGIFFLEYVIAFLLGRKIKSVMSKPLLIIALFWMSVAVWEIFCIAQGAMIRIDVFFIYPVLFAVSFLGFSASIVSMILSLFRKGS